ncbi:hypothetical protein STEG23_026927 [Scotinomys teguina]
MAAMLLPGIKVSPLLVRRKIARTIELQENIGKEKLPPCYRSTDGSGCTLQDFMDCPYNLAKNWQYNSTRAGGVQVDEDTIRHIEELNDLDMQLYNYAKGFFEQRYQYKRQLEHREQRLHNCEERLLHRSKEVLPREDPEEPGRVPTEDYMSHIIEK